MADVLVLRGIETSCHVGVTNEERSTPQPVWFDIELEVDVPRAARRDEVHEAVDYAKVADLVRELAEGREFHLLETMAEETATLLLEQFEVPEVWVRVRKRALAGLEFAAIEIARRRRPLA